MSIASEYTKQPAVTCVVLNWNNWKDTDLCLSALSKVEYSNLSVLVVDNGSTDDSVAILRKLHPGCPLIETHKNLGFAGGNNAGLRSALRDRPDYIWLLNNDTEPATASLSKLVEKAQSDTRLGAVGSVLMYADDPEHVQAWGGGRINRWIGTTAHASTPHNDTWFDYITAASILIPRKAFEEIGLLDETFFLYWEDTDFSFRLRAAGWRLGVAAESIVSHKENGSTRTDRGAFDRYATSSGLRFLQKHSAVPWCSIALMLGTKVANSLLTLRFRRLRFIAAGARDFFAQHNGDQPAANKPSHSDSLILNASRIGSVGGLRTFALDVLDCLSEICPATEVLLPQGTPPPGGLKVHWLPEWLGSSSRVSRLKPLLWLLYSGLFFPGTKSRPVLSTTHHALPFRRHQIVTVHDLRPYFLPDTWMQRFYFHFLLPRILRRCDGILTVSNASKNEIVSIYKIPGEKIHVVPNVVSSCGGLEREPPTGSTSEEPYLLMVGASWPHKNAVEVIKRHKLWEKDYRLKILAGTGQYRDLLLNLASKLGIVAKIDFLANVTDRDLHILYRDCAALIYPSEMEGFGLPPLEAMSFGKVVIVSDIPVFRELLGDVPIYVQLRDDLSWDNAFRQLSQIETTGENERCRAGRTLAAQFNKERMAVALQNSLSAIWGSTCGSTPLR